MRRIFLYSEGDTVLGTISSGVIPDSTDEFRIGQSNGGSFLDGDVDEVKFYKQAINDAGKAADLRKLNYRGYFTANYANHELLRKYVASNEPTSGTPTSEETTTGPASYWKLDEGIENTCSGGTNDACDSMSHNDAAFGSTTAAPTWKTENFCVAGKCAYFDGSNDYIGAVDSTSLRPANVTLAAWVRVNTNTGDYEFISKQYSTSTNLSYTLRLNSGVPQFSVCNTGATCATTNPTGTPLAVDLWFYLVGTYDGSTARLYQNGVQIKQTVATITIGYDASPVFIGARSIDSTAATPDTFFVKGFIDEVKIYPYARTAAQVKSDFSARGGSKGVSAVLGTNRDNNSSLSNGLAGYWPLDESSGNATDYSGNGTTLTNVNTTAKVAGKFGSAADFESGSTNYFYAADNTSLSITGDLTVAAWVRKESSGTFQYFIAKKDNLGRDSYAIGVTNSDKFRLVLYDSADVLSDTYSDETISDGVWYHFAGTYSQTERATAIYINGKRAASTHSGTIPAALEDNDGRFHIGAHESQGTPNALTDGVVDEARVYNRVLSPVEIESLYNWAPGAVGYWKFDENTGGTSSYDSSGNNFTATISTLGSTSWIPGKYGSALNYNGSDDVSSVAYNAALDGMGGLTVSAWVKPSACEASDAIVKKDLSYIVRLTGTCQIETYTWATTDANELDSTTTISTTDWTHVALVYDGSTQSIYINGVRETTTDPQTGSIDISGSETVTIGANDAGSEEYAGGIDEVRIYNYARNSKQIIEDMNAGHPTGGSPVGSPIVHQKFDEQQGSTTNNTNASWSSISGTTSNTTWKTAGSSTCKINGCLSFNGTTSSVSLGSPSALDNMTAFSISSWIKPNTSGEGGFGRIVQKAGDNSTDARGWTTWQDGSTLNISICTTDSGSACTAALGCTSKAGAITLNTWQHVAITWNGSVANCDGVKMYINGIASPVSGSNTGGATKITDASYNLLIGNEPGGARTFDGHMDEVKIYNSVLTADEIKIDYNAGSAIALGGVLGTQDDEGFGGNAPLGYWPFNENKDNTCTGGTNDTCDISGTGIDGAKTNMSATNWVQGKVGTALDFDGSDDYVSLGTSNTYNLTSDLTIEAWIRPDSYGTGNAGRIFERRGASSGFFFHINNSGQVCFVAVTIAAPCSNSSVFTLGQWAHVAFTRSGTTGTFYVNGIQQGTGTVSSIVTASGANAYIGTEISPDDRDFDGIIDEVKLYDYARTQAQVAYNYNRGGPVGYYKFDECQGTTAYNAALAGSGLAAGNNGTITPGAGSNTTAGTCGSGTTSEMWNDGTTGKRNGSLGFDGTDDYVTLGSVAQFNTANLTWSAWVKTTADTAIEIIANSDPTGNNDFLGLCLGSSCTSVVANELITVLHNSGGARSGYVTTNRNELFDGNWHHVAMTADGSKYHLYLDGRDLTLTTGQGSDDGTTAVASYAMTTIGAVDRSATNAFFDGQIDEVQIYNYALTANQIKKVMNNGAVFFGPATGTP